MQLAHQMSSTQACTSQAKLKQLLLLQIQQQEALMCSIQVSTSPTNHSRLATPVASSTPQCLLGTWKASVCVYHALHATLHSSAVQVRLPRISSLLRSQNIHRCFQQYRVCNISVDAMRQRYRKSLRPSSCKPQKGSPVHRCCLSDWSLCVAALLQTPALDTPFLQVVSTAGN